MFIDLIYKNLAPFPVFLSSPFNQQFFIPILITMPFVKANTHSLHYSDSHPAGPPTPTGLTFLFIHGLGSSQNYYFPVIPHLTSKHRCITIDTYGSARSTYTNDPISIPGIAADAIAVLDELKIPKAVVVGHSMGGLTVTEIGSRYPDRVLGVVAIGPTHPSEMLVTVMSKRSETVLESMYCLGLLLIPLLLF